jgi:hypothetical protein
MHRLKNKQTGIISSYTNKQLADLKKHPELLKLFDVISDKKESTPPELEILVKKQKDHNEQSTTERDTDHTEADSKQAP